MEQRDGRGRLFLVVFLPLALLFVLTGQGNVNRLSPDPVAAGVAAWSVAETGSLDLTGADTPRNPWLFAWHGKVLSNRSVGVIAFGVPAAVIGSAFTDDFSVWPERVTAALTGAGAAGLLAMLLLELGASRRSAGVFAALAALATGTWGVSSDALWTHGPDQLLITGALLACSRRRFWWAGGLLAGAATVRVHMVLVALVVGVYLAVRERQPARLLQFGVPAAASLAAIVGYAHAVFGLWSLTPGYVVYGQPTTSQVASSSLSSTAANFLGALFSPDRGLLTVSPIVLVLLTRLRPAWRVAPDFARAAALGGLAYFVFQLRVNHFTGGLHFWGYRLVLEPLTLCAPLLWCAWTTRQPGSGWERAARATLVLSVGFQLLGAVWISPDGLVPEWRHSYLVEVFDPDLHPVICQVVVLSTLAGALFALFWRRPAASPHAVPVAV